MKKWFCLTFRYNPKHTQRASLKSLGLITNSLNKSLVQSGTKQIHKHCNYATGLLEPNRNRLLPKKSKPLSKPCRHPRSQPWGRRALLVDLEYGEPSPKDPRLGCQFLKLEMLQMPQVWRFIIVFPGFSYEYAGSFGVFHDILHFQMHWCSIDVVRSVTILGHKTVLVARSWHPNLKTSLLKTSLLNSRLSSVLQVPPKKLYPATADTLVPDL